MTHLDDLVTASLAQSPDTVVHQLASEVVRLRGAITDALRPLYEGGHIYAKPLEDAIRKPAGERSRAIPADRELMRLVDELIRWHGLRPLDKRPDHAAALVGAIKALRAQPTQEPAS